MVDLIFQDAEILIFRFFLARRNLILGFQVLPYPHRSGVRLVSFVVGLPSFRVRPLPGSIVAAKSHAYLQAM